MIIINHDLHCGTTRKKTKTHGRFFSTIFFGGVGATVVVETQRLAMELISKK
jgi:hypothetical protein